MDGKEIFEIHVVIDDSFEVNGAFSCARMICFHGYAKSDFFEGEILPCAVDTQIADFGGNWKLSARYMLNGKDKLGNGCKIFIENAGQEIDGKIIAKPKIITDSRYLSWLEKANLKSLIENKGQELVIKIFEI